MKVPLRSFSRSLDAVGRRICKHRQVLITQSEYTRRRMSFGQSLFWMKKSPPDLNSTLQPIKYTSKNLRIGYSDPVVPNETAWGSLSPHLAPLQMEVGPDLWHPRRVRYLGLVIRPPLNDQTIGTPQSEAALCFVPCYASNACKKPAFTLGISRGLLWSDIKNKLELSCMCQTRRCPKSPLV